MSAMTMDSTTVTITLLYTGMDNTSVLPETTQTPQEDFKNIDVWLGYIYFILTGITSLLSMVGSLVIILSYVIYPDIRSSGRKLLVYLSIADFLTAFGNMTGIIWYATKAAMSPDSSKMLCNFHASLTFFSSISSFLWTVAIGLHLYLAIVRSNASLADKLLWPFHIICWLPALAIAIAALAVDVIGYSHDVPYPTWCWIDPEAEGYNWWPYLSGKGWEIAACVLTILLYARIKWHLIKQIRRGKQLRTYLGAVARDKARSRDVISTANRNLTFVPIVFVVSRIWGTIRFIIGAHFSYVKPEYYAWIVPLQGVGDSVQGFANCLMFCLFTPKMRKKVCLRMFPCCVKDDLPPEHVSSVEDNLHLVRTRQLHSSPVKVIGANLEKELGQVNLAFDGNGTPISGEPDQNVMEADHLSPYRGMPDFNMSLHISLIKPKGQISKRSNSFNDNIMCTSLTVDDAVSNNQRFETILDATPERLKSEGNCRIRHGFDPSKELLSVEKSELEPSQNTVCLCYRRCAHKNLIKWEHFSDQHTYEGAQFLHFSHSLETFSKRQDEIIDHSHNDVFVGPGTLNTSKMRTSSSEDNITHYNANESLQNCCIDPEPKEGVKFFIGEKYVTKHNKTEKKKNTSFGNYPDLIHMVMQSNFKRTAAEDFTTATIPLENDSTPSFSDKNIYDSTHF